MNNKNYYLYCLVDPRVGGEVRYIGITSQKPQRRLNLHLSDARHGNNNYRNNWIRQLLEEGEIPIMRELATFDNWQVACENEIKAIADLKAAGYGLVNGTVGGEGRLGFKLSEESKAKISLAKKGVKMSEEAKAKMSAAKLGANHPNFGKALSVETRKKIASATKGNKNWLGKKHSMETRAKLSASKKGENNPFYGKELSDEHKARISSNSPRKKPIKDQHDVIYSSAASAAAQLSLDSSAITKVLKNKIKQTGGYSFEYYIPKDTPETPESNIDTHNLVALVSNDPK